jgi:hypothetical protein
VTYLIVDRIVQARLREERSPLETQFIRSVEQAVDLMAADWARRLGVSQRDLEQGVEPNRAILKQVLTIRKDAGGDFQALRNRISSPNPEAILHMADSHVHHVERISLAAGRLPEKSMLDLASDGQLAHLQEAAHNTEMLAEGVRSMRDDDPVLLEVALLMHIDDVFETTIRMRIAQRRKAERR